MLMISLWSCVEILHVGWYSLYCEKFKPWQFFRASWHYNLPLDLKGYKVTVRQNLQNCNWIRSAKKILQLSSSGLKLFIFGQNPRDCDTAWEPGQHRRMVHIVLLCLFNPISGLLLRFQTQSNLDAKTENKCKVFTWLLHNTNWILQTMLLQKTGHITANVPCVIKHKGQFISAYNVFFQDVWEHVPNWSHRPELRNTLQRDHASVVSWWETVVFIANPDLKVGTSIFIMYAIIFGRKETERFSKVKK